MNLDASAPLVANSGVAATSVGTHNISGTVYGAGVTAGTAYAIYSPSGVLTGASSLEASTEAIYGPGGNASGGSVLTGAMTRFNPAIGGPKDISGNYVP